MSSGTIDDYLTFYRDLLRQSLGFYNEYFPQLMTISVLIYLPCFIIVNLFRTEGSPAGLWQAPLTVLSSLVFIGFVWRVYSGKEATIADAFGTFSLGLFLRLLLTRLLETLFILAGLILLIVPGIILGVWFFFIEQVVVIEGESYIKALQKSREIIKGNWWRVFWMGLVMLCIMVTIYLFTDHFVKLIFPTAQKWGAGIFIAQTFLTPFEAVVSTTFYFSLTQYNAKSVQHDG